MEQKNGNTEAEINEVIYWIQAVLIILCTEPFGFQCKNTKL